MDCTTHSISFIAEASLVAANELVTRGGYTLCNSRAKCGEILSKKFGRLRFVSERTVKAKEKFCLNSKGFEPLPLS